MVSRGAGQRRRIRDLGNGLDLPILGTRLGLVRLCGGERLVCRSKLGTGSGHKPFKLALRRRENSRLARRLGSGFFRFAGQLGGFLGLAFEPLCARWRCREGLRVRHE